MALDFLFNGAPPQSVTGSTASVTGLPDWYQEYLRGIAGKATEVAGQGYIQYPGEQVAGFTPDQRSSFDLTRQNVGQWQPYLGAATQVANQALPTATAFLGAGAQYGSNAVDASGSPAAPLAAVGAAGQANQSVGGPAATWTSNWQQYMSPYTQSVVNEIARLGTRNLNENILPSINSSFIGSGGFGSTRNADLIGRGIRDTQTNISGLQSQALEQGYGTSAGIFGSDAARRQAQEQLQANTALGGGQLVSGALNQWQQNLANTNLSAGQLATTGAQVGAAAADQSATRLGALGQLGQQLGYADAAALSTIGGQQQQLQQTADTAGYNNFLDQRNFNWSTLNNLNSVLRGMQLPASQTSVTNQPYGNVGTSPLQWASALYGLGSANGAAKTTTTGP